MKLRYFVFAMLCCICSVASAQVYSIRIAFNTNLRSSNSLSATIVETAPAGSTLNVTGEANRWLQINRNGATVWMASWVRHERVEVAAPVQPNVDIDNCCFVDRQCSTDQEWTDGYWAFQNGQCVAPVQTQVTTSTQPTTTAPAGVDNCCFIDRQCHTDQDWNDGYWAFQNNQCGTPAQTQVQVSTQPVATSAGMVDNCCFLGWSCHSDADWQSGFHAYQNNQCSTPPTLLSGSSTVIPNVNLDDIDNCCRYNRQCNNALDWERGFAAYQFFRCSTDIPMQIQGSPIFVSLYRAAYNLLKEISPRLYHYGITGFSRITENNNDEAGFYAHSNTYTQDIDNITQISEYDVVYAIGGILHEACHAHALKNNTHTSGWRNELPCIQVEQEGYRAADPDDSYGLVAWIQDLIDNIQNPAYWWWTD